MRRVARSLLASLCFVCALYPCSARAQTDDDRAAARAAATEGFKAFQEGRYKDSLDLCTRAEALMHAPTHLLLIARSQAKLGHLVEAQEAYFKIKRDSLAADAPHAFVEAQESANAEVAALTPRVPTLRVDVEGADPRDVKLTVDGAPVSSAVIGLARPINPGQHVLVGKSPTAESEPMTVTIAESSTQAVTLKLQPVAAAPAGATTAPEQPPEQASSSSGLVAGGWIGVGVGVAGLIAGTAFVLQNHDNRNKADALCQPNGCPTSQRTQVASLDSNANSDALLSWISFGVGGAGLATGAVLLWMGAHKPSTRPTGAATLRPWFGARSAGVMGTF